MARIIKQCCIIALALVLGGGEIRAGESPHKVKVAFSSVTTGFSGLYIAKEAGLFQKNGIDAELIVFPGGGQQAIQALIAGSIQMVMGGALVILEGNLQGIDGVILSSLIRRAPGFAFLVTPKEITRPEQLKGKVLGTDRVGGANDIVLRWTLRRFGLDPDKDVAIRPLGGGSPARVTALQNGQVQGALLSSEHTYLATERFGMNVAVDLRNLGLEFLSVDLVSSRTVVREQEDMVRRFVKSLVEAIPIYKNNRNQSLAIMAKYLRGTDAKVIEAGYNFTSDLYERKPYPAVNAIRWALDNAIRNPKAKTAKTEEFYDDRFIKELDQSGFIDGLYR
jgi:NitT/TauT family transport system substrate-binding protein